MILPTEWSHGLQRESAGKGLIGAPTRTNDGDVTKYKGRLWDYFCVCLLMPALSMAGVKDLFSQLPTTWQWSCQTGGIRFSTFPDCYWYLTKEPDSCGQPVSSGEATTPSSPPWSLGKHCLSFSTSSKILPAAKKAYLMSHLPSGVPRNHLVVEMAASMWLRSFW